MLDPVSINQALLMARPAADDVTGAAIDAALGLPAGVGAHEAWNTIDLAIDAANGLERSIDGDPVPIVTIAGRIWPALSASPSQDWVDLLAAQHGAELEAIDTADGEGSRERINGWVSEQTNDLISDLLPAGFITPQTELVLTNAVYFRAQWRTIFGKSEPIQAPFTLLDGTTTDIELMVSLSQTGPRGTGDGFVGAQLPYLGDEFHMLVIVPDIGRFAEVRDRLSAGFLDEIDATFTPGPYELRLPRWETTTSVDLISWLTEIGAAPGSYPGIGPGTVLAGGVHAADITVDDYGTEAAAATGLAFALSGPPEPELVVAADQPFLYLIRHTSTGAMLFVGQHTTPT